MRIAFLTPEFVTEYANGGGLGNYLNRLSRVLTAQGHKVEVFVLSDHNETMEHGPVLVHRVKPYDRWFPVRIAWRIVRILHLARRAGPVLLWLPKAKAIADAVVRRERERRFDLIQSADYQAVGLLVKHRAGRVHVVRCSGAWDLFSRCDGRDAVADRWQIWLERQAIRRADRAYAPSRCIADHFRSVHKIDVGVVRPPKSQEIDAAELPPRNLPPRFFVHFGQLMERKGTERLVRALPKVWDRCPDFTMVWAGRLYDDVAELMRRTWLEGENRVVLLGAIRKPELYAMLQQAEVAVLPSLVDNLPNTVIESLMSGIPVIGFRGASIDELVEDGKTGELVPMGDVDLLADALVRWWRGPAPIKRGFHWDADIARQMQPENAVRALFAFAGLDTVTHE